MPYATLLNLSLVSGCRHASEVSLVGAASDEAMALTACRSDEGSAIFFDFAAALPPVEHDFMKTVFRWLGSPPWLLTFIEIL